MIRFYYHPTPNPAKVALMLEETRLAYELVPVDTSKGKPLPRTCELRLSITVRSLTNCCSQRPQLFMKRRSHDG